MMNNRMFKAVILSCIFSICGLSIAKTIEIKDPFISAPSSIGKISLFHDGNGFIDNKPVKQEK